MKIHNRNSFFKYCTAETLKIILSSQRVRWSSPLRFNDPFDHLFRISASDNPSDHKDWFLEQCEKYVFGAQEPRLTHPIPHSTALLMLRRIAHDLDRGEFLKEMEDAFREGVENARKYLDSVNEYWDSQIKSARIFCVTEEPNNLLMWSHYTGSYSGAVLEIKCIEELDTPLCAARKVEYRSQMPKVGSYKEMFMYAFGLAPPPSNKTLYYDLSFVKSNHWSYEKEWRCVTYVDMDGLYTDYKFYPEEITRIYLGCRMEKTDKQDILNILGSSFSHISVFDMIIDENEYKLLPVRINR